MDAEKLETELTKQKLIEQNNVKVFSEKDRNQIEIIEYRTNGFMYIHYSDGSICKYQYSLIDAVRC